MGVTEVAEHKESVESWYTAARIFQLWSVSKVDSCVGDDWFSKREKMRLSRNRGTGSCFR